MLNLWADVDKVAWNFLWSWYMDDIVKKETHPKSELGCFEKWGCLKNRKIFNLCFDFWWAVFQKANCCNIIFWTDFWSVQQKRYFSACKFAEDRCTACRHAEEWLHPRKRHFLLLTAQGLFPNVFELVETFQLKRLFSNVLLLVETTLRRLILSQQKSGQNRTPRLKMHSFLVQ